MEADEQSDFSMEFLSSSSSDMKDDDDGKSSSEDNDNLSDLRECKVCETKFKNPAALFLHLLKKHGPGWL